jgi:hypothetical protein
MNPQRWGQIERLYHAALEYEPTTFIEDPKK